jgi:hypothetical protein
MDLQPAGAAVRSLHRFALAGLIAALVPACGGGGGSPRATDAGVDRPHPASHADAALDAAKGAAKDAAKDVALPGDTGVPPASTDASSTADASRPIACASSAACGSLSWCNPATAMCEPRATVPARTYVADLAPIIEVQRCASCHSPGGAATAGMDPALLLNGSDYQSWLAFRAAGTNCSDGKLRPLCVDEPSRSLLVARVLELPGQPSSHGMAFAPLYDSWEAPDLQHILEWIAQGAPFGGPVPSTDAGSNADARPTDTHADSGQADAPVAPPTCAATQDPAIDGCTVVDGSGVFVAPTGSDTAGAGTRAAPFATFAKALAVAGPASKPVLACAGDYVEAVDVGAAQDGAVILGGFDCATWAYTGAKLRLRPTAAGPALRVHDLGKGFELHDADVAAPDATAPGGTSNAAVVANAQGVVLLRVKLTAGKGANGAPGGTGPSGDTQLTGPDTGNGGGGDTDDYPNCGSSSCTYGGNGGGRSCADGAETFGGNGGGALNQSRGWQDGSGSAGGVDNATTFSDTSLGGTSTGSPVVCSAGQMGIAGTMGMGGTGARGTGSLSASGWTGLPGAAGKNGTPGLGGGGGGAASDSTCFTFPNSSYRDCSNVDGGGGGAAGGCGGGAGPGGGAGGASIALIVFSSSVTLVDCALVASDGGNGGVGGGGGPGQLGATPGKGYVGYGGTGCDGGLGGPGGKGGPGGGGEGGHSLGVAFSGTTPVLTRTTVTFGTAGAGGPAGTDSATPNQQPYAGVAGAAAATLSQWSDQTVDTTPPSAVTVTAGWASCHDLHVSWTTSVDDRPGTVTYTLCDGSAAGLCAKGQGQSTLVTSTTQDLTIASASEQFVSVAATDGSGNSTPSAEVDVAAYQDQTAPSAPTLSLYGVTTTALSFNVGGSKDDCSTSITYELCYATSSTGCQGTAASWSKVVTGGLSGLTPSTTYFVSARAYDAAGNRSAAVTQSATTVTLPSFSQDIVPFIQSNCKTSGCHTKAYNDTIPLDYATLTSGMAPPATDSTCRWIAPGANALSTSFIYLVTSGSACTHQQMAVANTDKLAVWLANGAPQN